LKPRNALGNEKTVKFLYLSVCVHLREQKIMYTNLNIQIYLLKNKFYFIYKSNNFIRVIFIRVIRVIY